MFEQEQRVDSNVVKYVINWTSNKDGIRNVAESEVVLGSLDEDTKKAIDYVDSKFEFTEDEQNKYFTTEITDLVMRYGKEDNEHKPKAVDETDRKWGIFEPQVDYFYVDEFFFELSLKE